MKLAIPFLGRMESLAAAQTERALLEQLPVDTKKLQRIAKVLEPRNLKLIGIALVGGGFVLSAASAIGHDRMYQAAVGREIRKQLEPVNRKLDELQAQNEELRRQNEELMNKLQKA